jgi:phosphate:Na+ symporter
MISTFNLIVLILATISLFLYGLRGFSDEIKNLNSDTFKTKLDKLSSNKLKAFILGAVFTGIIQSSSAVTAITVALVDSGMLAFKHSLALMLGSNVGTTTTAWLVTFKLNNIGPYFIVLGTIISAMPIRAHLYGKSIFYFGFILFSLDLIQDALQTAENQQIIIEWLSHASNPLLGVLMGVLATILLQSSSLVSGLIIILATQNLIQLDSAIAIIMGCNVGTTSTALYSSIRMNKLAKRSALANFSFNIIGLIFFLPLLSILSSLVMQLDARLEFQVAFAHLIFNLTTALMILPFLDAFSAYFSKGIALNGQSKLNT